MLQKFHIKVLPVVGEAVDTIDPGIVEGMVIDVVVTSVVLASADVLLVVAIYVDVVEDISTCRWG